MNINQCTPNTPFYDSYGMWRIFPSSSSPMSRELRKKSFETIKRIPSYPTSFFGRLSHYNVQKRCVGLAKYPRCNFNEHVTCSSTQRSKMCSKASARNHQSSIRQAVIVLQIQFFIFIILNLLHRRRPTSTSADGTEPPALSITSTSPQ
jgi:hypothetical protein